MPESYFSWTLSEPICYALSAVINNSGKRRLFSLTLIPLALEDSSYMKHLIIA